MRVGKICDAYTSSRGKVDDNIENGGGVVSCREPSSHVRPFWVQVIFENFLYF